MNTTICENVAAVRDALGKVILPGARIVYAVREGSCMAALRTATVVSVYAVNCHYDLRVDYCVEAVTSSNKKVKLSYPDRIAVIA